MSNQTAWQAKFEEIVAFIGRELFGNGLLTQKQQAEARKAAEDAVDEWEMAEIDHPEGLIAATPLQRLLAEQNELANAVLDARDADLPGYGRDIPDE